MTKFKVSRLLAVALASVGVVGASLAEGEFAPVAAGTAAATSIGLIAISIGGLLTAAIAIYVGFLGYRKIREGLSRA